MDLIREARALQEQIVAWRRDFHRHPELGFHETRTAGIVADELERLGFAVRRGVGRTGVLGDLDVPGARGRMLLRADMDALPIQEESGDVFASEVPGVAHLCGHDAHTAMLLGAAMLLARRPLAGQVRLLFQPSEEMSDAEGISGAPRMAPSSIIRGAPLMPSASLISSDG